MWLLAGCGDLALANDESLLGAERPNAYSDERITEAERNLTRHNISAARDLYRAELDEGDARTQRTAAAGKALTDLMLLPGDDAARTLLIDQFGAQNRDYDVEQLVWSDDGMLFWFSQGVRWDNDGEYEGVRSIVEDNLPWSVERLESAQSFGAGLDQSGDLIIEDLLPVAQMLRAIEVDLQTAIGTRSASASTGFEYFYLPAAVFHSESFSLTLGRSDLAALHAIVSMTRGMMYFVAAYAHPWTIEQLTSPPQGRSLNEHFYTSLDPQLGRAILSDVGTSRLREAQAAFSEALRYLELSLEIGLNEPTLELAILRWDRVDPDTVAELRTFINDLGYALEGPQTFDQFDPAITIDLSVLFDGTRTLPEDVTWFESIATGGTNTTNNGQTETYQTWAVRTEALDTFFLRGVVDTEGVLATPPSFGEGLDASFALSDDQLSTFQDNVLEPTQLRLEETYSGSGLLD